MKKPAALVLMLLMGAACGFAGAGPAPEDMTGVADGITAFSLDLYAKLGRRDGNLFCSPFSISTALAMTYAGARGSTEKQMAHVLHFGPDQDVLHPAYGALLARLGSDLPGCELNMANRLWAQEDCKFLVPFLETARKDYGAEVALADFATQAEAARVIINRWVEKQTRDRIRDLVRRGMLGRDTRMVLVNAIYFKGRWATQFKKEQTKDEPFTGQDGRVVTVPMMYGAEPFRYLEDETMQVLELPYEGRELSMVVLLPRKIDGLGELEKSLTADSLNERLGRLSRREVRVYLPRFTMTSEFELSETLGGLGMPEAFTAAADFSGMTGDRSLFISAVIHKAFVDVNEEGTEAAAATAVVMMKSAMMPSAPPAVFRADHPFVFMIQDNRTGAILFIGRVADPSGS